MYGGVCVCVSVGACVYHAATSISSLSLHFPHAHIYSPTADLVLCFSFPCHAPILSCLSPLYLLLKLDSVESIADATVL